MSFFFWTLNGTRTKDHLLLEANSPSEPKLKPLGIYQLLLYSFFNRRISFSILTIRLNQI